MSLYCLRDFSSLSSSAVSECDSLRVRFRYCHRSYCLSLCDFGFWQLILSDNLLFKIIWHDRSSEAVSLKGDYFHDILFHRLSLCFRNFNTKCGVDHIRCVSNTDWRRFWEFTSWRRSRFQV